MAAATADVMTKVSAEAARRFVESYYPALQTDRGTLASFYLAPTPPGAEGRALPTIVINGNPVPDPRSLQTVFETQMPQAHYEVQSYDCQVLNADLAPAGATRNPSPGKNMSIVLTVSGYVRYGESRSAVMRGFDESIILVPYADPSSSNRGRDVLAKDWLIQCQNFRLVV